MSNLSGYDSEAVGFDSVSSSKKDGNTCSTQTTEFAETGSGCQTNLSRDCGCLATPDDLNAQDDVLREYPPPGLNEFLRKVMPGVMEQLDQNDRDASNSSDSDEEEVPPAKLFQEINANANAPSLGSGDHQNSTILDITFSSGGNSLAVSLGKAQHEQWCEHDGIIRIYTVKRLENDKFVHSLDITEKNCVTALRYHPTVAAMLAYGTTSGEVVLCSLRPLSSSLEENVQLTSPSGCHGSQRVSFLMWADSGLANTYLTMQIVNTGKRRGASDQILISSGSDGTINVWQVNSNLKIFENVVCYSINGSRKMAAPDISCFDYIKTYPLRSWDEKIPDDIFVVGTKCGKLYLCKVKNCEPIVGSAMVDPVFDALEGHKTCVLSVVFSYQKPGIFATISMDSELRLYHVNQLGPLKIVSLDVAATCAAWLAGGVALGAAGAGVELRDAAGRPRGALRGEGVCLAVLPGTHRIAVGDSQGQVRIWDAPARRLRLSTEDFLF